MQYRITLRTMLSVATFLALAVMFLTICIHIASGQTSRPVDRIEGAGGAIFLDTQGNGVLRPRNGRSILVPSSLIQPPVSAANTASIYYDAVGGTLRISVNGLPYVNLSSPTGAGTGTVSSIGITLPANVFTVNGSPITNAGTITVNYVSQTANSIFAAPNGVDGTPAFRFLVPADIPALDVSKITSGTLSTERGGTGLAPPFTLGDLLYTPTTTTWGRLQGHTGTTRRFLYTQGNGTNVTALGYTELTASDIPAVNLGLTGNGGIAGVLPIASGGTGLDTTGAANSFLGVNSTGGARHFKTLQAGSNVSINYGGTQGDTVTISASGTLEASVEWGTITNPSGALALNMSGYTSAFAWSSHSVEDADYFSFTGAESASAPGNLVRIRSQNANIVPLSVEANNGAGFSVDTFGFLLNTGSTIRSGAGDIVDSERNIKGLSLSLYSPDTNRPVLMRESTGLELGSALGVRWSGTTAAGSNVLELRRLSGSTLKLTNGSTGRGGLIVGSLGVGLDAPATVAHFSGAGITSFTGTQPGLVTIATPSIVQNAYRAIDFKNYDTGAITARIAAKYAGTYGSQLHFGTSSADVNGITNDALVINPSGNVFIGADDATNFLNNPARLTVSMPTSPASFTGEGRGTLALSYSGTLLSNTPTWRTLDFLNADNQTGGGAITARLGVWYNNLYGSMMFLGTSNNDASGITNSALAINTTGRVIIGGQENVTNFRFAVNALNVSGSQSIGTALVQSAAPINGLYVQGSIRSAGVTYAQLITLSLSEFPVGSSRYCTDCDDAATGDCTSAGNKDGAMAFRNSTRIKCV